MPEMVLSTNFQAGRHLVFGPPIRHAALAEEVAEAVAGMLDHICGAPGWPVISQEVQPDQIHWFLSAPPRHDIQRTEHSWGRT